MDTLRAAGLLIGGWHYLYGKNPGGEADRAASRIEKFNLDFYELDIEHHYKEVPVRKRAAHLDLFFRRLRKHVGDDYPLGNCSYRYPSVHPEIPWEYLLGHTNYHAPQNYWVRANNPADQLVMSLTEYRNLENRYGLSKRPYYPVGASYEERGWRPTIAEMDMFDAKAQELGLPGVMWYRWGEDIHGAQYWEYDKVIANHNWWLTPPDPPDPPFVPLEEWSLNIDEWARGQGYDGPRPIA